MRWDLYTPSQRRQAAIDGLPHKIEEIDARVERLHTDLERAHASIERIRAAPGGEMTKRIRLTGAVRERNGILGNIRVMTAMRERLRSTAASYENVELLRQTRTYIDTILRAAGGEDLAEEMAQTTENIQEADKEQFRLEKVIDRAMQPVQSPILANVEMDVDDEVARLLATAPVSEPTPVARNAREALRKIKA